VLSKLEVDVSFQELDRIVQIHVSSSLSYEREAAAEALGYVGSSVYAPVRDCLIARLSDASPGVRSAAVRSIARLYKLDSTAINAICGYLATCTGEVRAAMLEALGSITAVGDETAAIAATNGIEDSDLCTRQWAVDVLGRLCDDRCSLPVKTQLIHQLDGPDPAVRKSAVEALILVAGHSSGDSASIEMLACLLAVAETWGIRRAATDALLGIVTDDERGVTVSISSMVESQNESVWQRNLKTVLAFLRPEVR
jgi:hypothetical protein